MTYKDVVVLYPSHGLEDFPTDLSDEKAGGLLNGFAVAWHPALLAQTKAIPSEHRADEPPPTPVGRLVIVPPACNELLPAGWIDEARSGGATVVSDVWERGDLIRAVLEPAGLTAPADGSLVSDFFALGTCRLLLELLTRRMHHFGEMDDSRLERDAVAAAEAAMAADVVAAQTHLRNAFEVLTEARERFYPVECYLLDLCLLIPRLADAPLSAAISRAKPFNVIVTGADIEQIAAEKPVIAGALRHALDEGSCDLVGGENRERPVPLLPLTSVLREFELGRDAFLDSVGRAPTTWGRRRYGFATLIPQILYRYGYHGALHVALDDGLYPDAEQSKTRWEGCDGTVIDATTRIPLAAESAASYLRFPSRMAESMQQDQTAAVIWARWPEVQAGAWGDFERIHEYAPVLGRFVTFRRFFESAEDPGRLSKFDEREYLSPFLIQAVAAQETDPISRFRRHFERRARFDGGAFLDALNAALRERPITTAEVRALEDRLERSGPDLPHDDSRPTESDAQTVSDTATVSDAEIDAYAAVAAGRLGASIVGESNFDSAAGEPGYLILNTVSFDRTVTVELPRLESAPPLAAPVRGTQFDATHRHVTVDLPGCGYVWVGGRGSQSATKPASARGTPPSAMAEGTMIRNEFIEVHVNEATGGIARVKQFGRRPNRLSQQLAFRFPRERAARVADGDAVVDERTYYSQMVCGSITTTARGPGLGEIATTGTLVDPEGGAKLAEFRQTIRVWRGRPIIELDIDLETARQPEGDPWSNYFASRFAWNDSAATLTRSVLGGAHPFRWERFESPHFLEIATETQRTTLLNGGLPFHRKTGPRMVDSILIVAGETSRRFRFGIAIDSDYPLLPAMDLLVPPAVIATSNGPPASGRSGWLFHLDAKNVQILKIAPLREAAPGDEEDSSWEAAATAMRSGYGLIVRLFETEGRHRPVQLRCFRTPESARRCDFRGRTIAPLKIIDDAVLLEMTGFEIADVELRFGKPESAVNP